MRRRDRGSALLVAIVTLVVVAVAAQALHAILLRDVHGFRAERRAVELQALTDAALAATLSRLSVDAGSTGVPRRRLGSGFFESRTRGVEPGTVEVLATGGAGRSRATVRAVVALGTDGPRVLRWERSVPGPVRRR